ncbi:NAD(+)/NADH kinase [Malaciobacter mytili]|uniref:NAD kinase n=1 Tax=Malaciobacter mytili LMG 24559 TaxID=1032238 RepID=A0AAX2AIN8_9BACT|nr:NAD(+)/NADH kinase [Malaciobacter mytili]AXH15794.1 inorganic polyphosphate/ATP-NAD kinase [Malaciobacter mytili LMG 24559]RXI39422.1 NAD(+) kinase [Malaciobacter mytili]RXK15386.1 NAD(+) kinase [Malaciobacter mytili LMG 24559]
MKRTISKERLASKSKVGIVLRPSTPEIKNSYLKIKECFEKHNIKVYLERNSANMINEDGIELDTICENVDFLVSVGGDGTLISVVRRSFSYNKPVLGINLGTLGFLTDIRLNELETFLDNLDKDNYRIDSRMMIKGSANLRTFFAFNDIVISRNSLSSMIRIDAKLDGRPFNSYYGDGVIISSPTGSTAYNLSLGGPLVYPLTDAFIVTPVAPHSLTQRPLVLPADFEIEFTISDNQGAVVIVDGQDIYEIEQNQSIKIQIASKKAKLLHRRERNYFEVLNEKLQWGN